MFLRGQVVKSIAGRDKDYFMCIVGCDEKYIFVCDGKERRLKCPKRKNPKHVFPYDKILDESQLHSDKSLRKALAQLEYKNE